MSGLIRALCLAAMLLPITMGLSRADEPTMELPGPGGKPADIEREVLWLDNPDFYENVAGSEVIGAYDLWTEVANDFVLASDATIRKVTWWGCYWNDYDGIPTGSGFNIRFYMPAPDCLPEDAPLLEYLLPGNDCCEEYAEGGDQYSQYVYEYCLELPLPAGRYWFSVQMADHDFPPQWGRQGAEDWYQECESAFRSPYFSYPEWAAPWWPYPWDASQMFEDVCNPTPVLNGSWGAVKQLYR
jgi:hypothetical protein